MERERIERESEREGERWMEKGERERERDGERWMERGEREKERETLPSPGNSWLLYYS
jgi:hypothetical protein